MKKFLFISLFSLCYVFANAQTYHPMPDSNAVWIIESYGGQGPDNYTYIIDSVPANNKDTLIGNYFYNKIYERKTGANTSPTTFIGAYRNDSTGKVFFVASDSVNEYLIRDFSKNIGDSVHIMVGRNALVLKYIVDSVTQISVGNYSLKKMYLSTPAFSCFDNIIWTEKIGCQIGGIFNESNNCGVGPFLLQCMSYNDTIYCSNCRTWEDLPSYTAGICLLTVGIDQIDYSNLMHVFPNPFSDYILLKEFPKNIEFEIKLFNSKGEMIYKKNIKADDDTVLLNCKNIPAGIYYAVITTTTKLVTTKKLLKIN